MNTYTINKDKVKICLTEEEVQSLFGGYDNIDYDCPRSRAVLDSLLLSALPESMLPLDCKRILIEVTEERSGCSIQITRLYGKEKCSNKIKGIYKYILLFDNSEDMINFLTNADGEIIKGFKNSKLVLYGTRYGLTFCSEKRFSCLEPYYFEYGKPLEQNTALAACFLEHGKTVCHNAAQKLLSAFK